MGRERERVVGGGEEWARVIRCVLGEEGGLRL